MKRISYYLYILTIISIIFSCGKREENGSSGEVGTSLPNPVVVQTPKVGKGKFTKNANLKLYIENTASMNGYIEGFTGFKEVLARLINEVEDIDSPRFSTHVYLINNKITELNIRDRITTDLTKNNVIGKGDRGNSEFEKVISKILDEHQNNEISVLAADFIYSPKDGETQKRLKEFQEFTKKAFLDADIKENNIEVLFLRFNSDFNAEYYDINNKDITGIDKRPYYLMVLANQELMKVFTEKVNPSLMTRNDFDHMVYFDTKGTDTYSLSDYSILTSTLNSGPLKANKIEDSKIKSISASRNGKLQLAIALDLSNIPVSEEYKMDHSNYELENYTITKIGKIDDNQIIFPTEQSPTAIMGADKEKLQNLTHVFVINSTEEGIKNLELKIKKEIPSWIDKFSNTDDRDIAENPLKQSQTFGLKFFIEGVDDAYKRNGNIYFSTLSVGILPISEGSGMGSIFVILLIVSITVGIIFIIKNKNSRR